MSILSDAIEAELRNTPWQELICYVFEGEERPPRIQDVKWSRVAEIAADAAVSVLDDEQSHVLRVTETGGWTLKHPLSCRAETGLFDCVINRALEDGITIVPGTWTVEVSSITEDGGGFEFTRREF